MRVVVLSAADALWEPVAQYAENCSWGGGQKLAQMMRDGFSGWERTFVAMEGTNIAGYCTLQITDRTHSHHTPYVRFVFIGEAYRGHRLSERLCQAAIEYAKSLGFERVYLRSEHVGLYEKYGFVKIEEEPGKNGRPTSTFVHGT